MTYYYPLGSGLTEETCRRFPKKWKQRMSVLNKQRRHWREKERAAQQKLRSARNAIASLDEKLAVAKQAIAPKEKSDVKGIRDNISRLRFFGRDA